MKILFVTGPSFSGKSIYIRKEYKDARVVNINVFKKSADAAETNEELEEIAKNAYFYCREALMNTIRKASENDTVVLEAQLLSKKARTFFLNAVREVTDTPVECVLLCPDEKKIRDLLKDHPTLISLHEYEKDKLEIPSTAEGFSAVTEVFPEFEDTDWFSLVRKN
jgi:hypothetical protein